MEEDFAMISFCIYRAKSELNGSISSGDIWVIFVGVFTFEAI